MALLTVGRPATAATNFIASTRVTPDATGAVISIRFNCQVDYLMHSPDSQGDRLRIQLDPTTICNGIAPTAAQTRIRLRPAGSDAARLLDLEYDGESQSGPTLVLNFSEPVAFAVDDPASMSFELDIRVGLGLASAPATVPAEDKNVQHRQVVHESPPAPDFVINLVSLRRMPTLADAKGLEVPVGRRLSYAEAVIDGATWYRLRLGDFDSAEDARAALEQLGSQFAGAWVDHREPGSIDIELVGSDTVGSTAVPAVAAEPAGAADAVGAAEGDEVDRLMAEAKREIVAGNTPRAIQIYTKILQLPPHPRQPEAQEYLAVAREKQGQLAHAKAEYQRYLSLYPNAEGAGRVSQRLAALLAGNRPAADTTAAGTVAATPGRRRDAGLWRMQTYVSQYYRRDVNQPGEQDDIVTQSALYSDVSVDARRRGERFDISTRLTAGYRNDLLGEGEGSGNETRISYAYVDVADARTGLQGRLGRQSRNTGGVLGRFDGLNLGYKVTDRVLVNAVFGKPVYRVSEGTDPDRTFYGAGVTYGPLFDGLELGLYAIQQKIDGIDDRQAIGGEFRYFGDKQSIWGLIDYDTLYSELGSAFLQTNWRLGSKWSLHGSFDMRHTPFLSTGNALIGQPVETFSELADIFSADELQQLGLDRSPMSTTVTAGVAYSMTPNLQLNVDANHTTVEATPDSGGVFGTPAATYNYVTTSLVASSLFREGDVTIFGARYSDTDTSRVMSLTLDSRFPIGSSFRINPRLRVDRRERLGEADYEWLYTPGLRLQLRRGRKVRIELEAGKQYVRRTSELNAMDRASYFVNLGYQAFF